MNYNPVLLEDGNDNMDTAEIIDKSDLLEIEVENRDFAGSYNAVASFTPGNSVTLGMTLYQATTTATPYIFLATGPTLVAWESNGAWGELQMFRCRFRATVWTLHA